MIVRGDARKIPLEDQTVQCIVTSPPYFQLRDYQCGPRQIGLEATPDQYAAMMAFSGWFSATHIRAPAGATPKACSSARI